MTFGVHYIPSLIFTNYEQIAQQFVKELNNALKCKRVQSIRRIVSVQHNILYSGNFGEVFILAIGEFGKDGQIQNSPI